MQIADGGSGTTKLDSCLQFLHDRGPSWNQSDAGAMAMVVQTSALLLIVLSIGCVKKTCQERSFGAALQLGTRPF
jgi:hypothetical protein